MIFSIFPNVYKIDSPQTINLKQFLEFVQIGRWKQQINELRQTKEKTNRDKLKKKIPQAAISGTFTKREKNGILLHSGLLGIDIDNEPNPAVCRDKLAQDPHIIASFISPSGTGVKAIMLIEKDTEKHEDYFLAAKAYFKGVYNLEIDKNCRDVSRGVLASFDPALKRNAKATLLDLEKWLPEPPPKSTRTNWEPSNDEAKVLADALNHIPSEDYQTWVKVGMALKSSKLSDSEAFGLWDGWSSRGATYKGTAETDKRWNSFDSNGGISTGTLISIAKENGWTQEYEQPKINTKAPKKKSKKPEPTKETQLNPETKPDDFPDEDLTPDFAGLIFDGKGRMKPILANAEILIRGNIGTKIVFNSWSYQTEIIGVLPWQSEKGRWTSVDDTRCTSWLQSISCNIGSIKTVAAAVESIARENTVQPLKDFLDGLVWDKTSRLDSWLSEFCGVEQNDYHATVGRKWLVAAAARVFEPGIKFDHMLILEGKPDIGKSSLLAALGGEFFSDDFSEMHGKGAAERTVGAWIIEIAELDAMGKSEVSAVKAFITRQVDRFRPAYGSRVEEYPRTCVFAGTVNPAGHGYLRDPTGNRRFWPVACVKANVKGLKATRNQLLAEAVALYKSGEKLYLEDEKTKLKQYKRNDNSQILGRLKS
mgnify:CR=1 FL=1